MEIGLIALTIAIIVSSIYYCYKKNIPKTILVFLLTFLTIIPPLHLLTVPAILGYYTNNYIYKYIKNKWTTILLTIPVAIPLTFITIKIAQLYLTYLTVNKDLGGTLASIVIFGPILIIIALIGTTLFLLTSLITSLLRKK